MKRDIILAGVGGQGILTTARIIYTAAASEGLNVKQTEVHGMSQRGGTVESHLRISSQPIYSPLVPLGHCDLIIATEPLEALRKSPYLAGDGAVVTSTIKVKNIPDYPQEDFLSSEIAKLARALKGPFHSIDPASLVKEGGSVYAQNTALLGAATPLTGLKPESIQAAIADVFKGKGKNVVSANLRAFHLGLDKMDKVST